MASPADQTCSISSFYKSLQGRCMTFRMKRFLTGIYILILTHCLSQQVQTKKGAVTWKSVQGWKHSENSKIKFKVL